MSTPETPDSTPRALPTTGQYRVVFNKVHMRTMVCKNLTICYIITLSLLRSSGVRASDAQRRARLPPARRALYSAERPLHIESTLLHLAEGQRLNNRQCRQVGRRGGVLQLRQYGTQESFLFCVG